MPRLILYHSPDPEALLAHAAAPFLHSGRPPEPLPLLVVRQGTLRDEVTERAARAGCAGWLGKPLRVFGELPDLFAGEGAALSVREREVLLGRLIREVRLEHLDTLRGMGAFVAAIDALLGDLHAECITPEAFRSALDRLPRDDWEEQRDGELTTLYAAYLDALPTLPACRGVARTDGRDGLARAAEAVRSRPDEVRHRLHRPFQPQGHPCSISILGLGDLRRGWRLLLDALLAAPFVDELRVYLQLNSDSTTAVPPLSPSAGAGASWARGLGEGDSPDIWNFLAPRAAEIRELAPLPRPPGLERLRDTLFRLDADPFPPPPEVVRVLAAPDRDRELAEVARRVKRLILEDGVEPQRIAVVPRESRPYAPAAVEALQRLGVPVSARLRHPLAEVPAIAALLRVFRAAAEGWTGRVLMDLAESPYFDLELDIGILRWITSRGRPGTLDEWEAILAALAARDGEDDEDDDAWSDGPDPARSARAWDAFRAFREVAEPFGETRPLSAWLGLALEALGRDGAGGGVGLWGLAQCAAELPGPETDHDAVEAVRLDAKGIEHITGLLHEWIAALALDPRADRTLAPREWYAELARALGAEQVALRTPHRRGVQVLEALAAAGRPWDHLFLVGMNAGAYPAEPLPRPLYGEIERAALRDAGIPLEPAAVWFAREASLFRGLVAGAWRSLHLSHAYADGRGTPLLRSAYLDDVVERLTAGEGAEPVETLSGSQFVPDTLDGVWCAADLGLFAARGWADEAVRADANAAFSHLLHHPAHGGRTRLLLHTAGIGWERHRLRTDPPAARHEGASPWNGRITDPELVAHLRERFGDAVWSASRLEAYGNCPWTFFAHHVLGLKAVRETDDDLDALARGSLLHLCLERLHRQLLTEFGDGALDPAHADRASDILAELVPAALDELAVEGWTGAPELRAAREQELCQTLGRYIRWEMEENAKETRAQVPRRVPLHFELVFGMGDVPPVVLRRGGRELRLRGRIDRVDELAHPDASGWRYLVDHKSGGGALTPVGKYEEGAILQLPLYLRALEQMESDDPERSGVWGGAYQIIRECGRTAALHPRSLTQKGIVDTGKRNEESRDRIDAALDHALDHVDAILNGAFPAAIPACSRSTGCPPYCDFIEICRQDVHNEGRT